MVLLRYVRHHLKPEKYGYGYPGLFLQALNEGPQYLFSIPIICVITLALPWTLYKWYNLEGYKRRYMTTYTVFRSDHPLIDNYQCLNVTDKDNIIDMQSRPSVYSDKLQKYTYTRPF